MADPNNIIFPKHRLAFMPICKTGSSSLKRALMNTFGISGDNPHDDRIFEYARKEDIAMLDGWLTISIVRHPADRLISCWADKVKRRLYHRFAKMREFWEGMSFDKFVKAVSQIPDCSADQHYRSQAYDLFVDGRQVPQHIFRLEEIGSTWERVQDLVKSHCGVKISEFPHEKRSKVGVDVNNETLGIIKVRYADDFKLFGYEGESWL